ncbi:MAG TPA: hypothetical protein VGL38_09670 [bacterium]|jgi:hypothetical protein
MPSKKSIKAALPSNHDTERFDVLYPLLQQQLLEIRELSKRKQDVQLNKLKVDMINRVLSELKTLLAGQPMDEFLALLDSETLPTNSDAVLVLAQFLTASQQCKSTYYRFDEEQHEWRWSTKENPIRKLGNAWSPSDD